LNIKDWGLIGIFIEDAIAWMETITVVPIAMKVMGKEEAEDPRFR
jgi:hypothetical protein